MNQKKYLKVRASVCAVGYMDILFSEGKPFDIANDLFVLGTGFLIGDNKVLTNRHVIEALKSKKSSSYWTLLFFNDSKNLGKASLKQGLIGVEFPQMAVATGGVASALTDLGVLVPKEPFDSQFLEHRKPVEFGDLNQLRVGKDLSICGYAGGNSFITFDSLQFSRAGPLTHFGKVSALAPWDFLSDGRQYTNILTDISNGGGFSGSPVFCPTTGQVYGIHYAGNQNYGLGISHPLDKQRASDIALNVDCRLNGLTTSPVMNVLGDIEPESRKQCIEFLNNQKKG